MLTRKQYELLMFIDERLRATGISPSFDEMKDALDLKSKSGIHRLITGLEERGFIRRLAHRARALEVVRLPENRHDQTLPPPAKAFAPNVIKGGFASQQLVGAPVAVPSDSVSLPLYGKIAAGTAIEALSDHSRSIDIPASMLGSGNHYALTVEGDSMIEAGINDGDTVVIRSCDSAETGTIVVALVDDTEVTLKRLRRKGTSVALEPANKAYETRVLPPDRVKVQGRLVGLLRSY
ncbi:SOS-response repressor and protease LexA [Paramagnetospirillum magnetotacticum MS-1]|uniref:LexA repressor n=1 Tax=Paramagnetospirillum magnetotacticum MS-1 TaxID=272627 RepID=A0A0C2YW88_PARME|nr:transcriptional repressor LexA [Paramagnetospirillum magnetotacticum]KIL99383.1 SOS-response repressor and protease LexA [Paramagnetospirillum magnetotacticum MS-1]